MFSRIRRHFTYANVAMMLALVLVTSGGAYAASKYVITSTKQIKPSVLKQLQGKKVGPQGATGATGATGSAGPAGGQGPAGPKGDAGVQGIQGEKGEPGAKGEKGETGFTATLPSGNTLKGVWSVSENVAGEAAVLNSVSFGIPLAKAPIKHYINPNGKEWALNGTTHEPEEVTPASGCTGEVEKPGAEKGNLCIFAREENNNVAHVFSGIKALPVVCALEQAQSCILQEGKTGSPFGFSVYVISLGAGAVVLYGTWAVTAE